MTRLNERHRRSEAKTADPFNENSACAAQFLDALRRLDLHRLLRVERCRRTDHHLRLASVMRLSEAPAYDAAALHARHVLTPWVAQGGRNPPVVVRGEGSYLYDDRGKRYIDFSA